MSYEWCGCGGSAECARCNGTGWYFDEPEYAHENDELPEDWNETAEFDDKAEGAAD